jgi:hypothetical protein
MFPDKPHALPLSIAPGDLVRAAIMPKDTKNWIITFENSTKKKKTSISIPKKKSFQSAFEHRGAGGGHHVGRGGGQ